MNPVIDAIYEALELPAPASGRPGLSSAVQRASGRMLYERVRAGGFERTLEVGLGYGLSALYICQAHADRGAGAHVAVDPYQTTRFESRGLAHLERAGLRDRLTLYEAPSYAVLPRLVADGTVLDFAFIDGRHLFDYALVDFFYIDLMLRDGGEIAIDDLWMPGVQAVVAFVLRNRAYTLLPPPEVEADEPVGRRIGRVVRRYVQQPWGGDGRLKRYPLNACLLRKESGDDRPWNHHHSF